MRPLFLLTLIVALLYIASLGAFVPRQAPLPLQAPPVQVVRTFDKGGTAPTCGMTDCPCGCAVGKPCLCKSHRAAGWKWQRAFGGQAGYWWKEVPVQAPEVKILQEFTHTNASACESSATSLGTPSFGTVPYEMTTYGAASFGTPSFQSAPGAFGNGGSYQSAPRRGFFGRARGGNGNGSGGGCGG